MGTEGLLFTKKEELYYQVGQIGVVQGNRDSWQIKVRVAKACSSWTGWRENLSVFYYYTLTCIYSGKIVLCMLCISICCAPSESSSFFFGGLDAPHPTPNGQGKVCIPHGPFTLKASQKSRYVFIRSETGDV